MKIIQKLNAEADRIIGNKLLPVKSRPRYEQVYKLFIEWQNEKKCSPFSEEILIVYYNEKICLLIFTNHASFRDTIYSWNILSSFRLRIPRRGFAPGLHRGGAAPGTPAPPSTRMPAIIAVTQAANFHALIG